MNLGAGQRLTNGDRSAYEIIGPAWETPARTFLRARKRFWNYRERDRSLYEAGPEEALGVLLRVPRTEDRAAARAGLAFELEHVFTIPDLPWLPGLVDVIGLDGADPPVLVLADPGAVPTSTPPGATAPAPWQRLACEAIELLAAFHGRGLAAGGFEPSDVALDARSGRWTFLATDRVRRDPFPESRRVDLRGWVGFARPLAAMGGPRGGPDRQRLATLLEYAESARSAADLIQATSARRRMWSAFLG